MRWPDARIDDEFNRNRIYPYRLDAMGPSTEAVRLFAAWLHLLKQTFATDGAVLPWVPVGSVGPVLLIGHSEPSPASRAPIPNWLAQHVLLTPKQHGIYVAAAAAALKSVGDVTAMLPPKSPTAQLRPVLSSAADALDFLASSIPLARNIRDLLIATRAKIGVSSPLPELPEGIAESVGFFRGTAMLTDVRVVLPDVETQRTVPEQLRHSHSAVGVFSTERYHYIAVPRVPNSGFEDMVLALAQGLKKRGVRLLLAPVGQLKDQIEKRAINRRDVRESSPARASSAGGPVMVDQTSPNFVINEKQMEAFDPRRMDADNELRLQWTIWKGYRLGASDLHYEQIGGRGRVRARIDGVLREICEQVPDKTMKGMVGVAKGGAFPGLTQSSHDKQDGRATIRIGDALVNLRVSLIPHRRDRYQVMVLRLLPKNTNLLKLDKLGISPRNVRILRRAFTAPSGIVFVTGPTGSGKTTSLYAGIEELNNAGSKINTIEDPVEIEVEGPTQSMVNEQLGVTFDELMEGALRQDPDVILVGEVRSRETARLVLQASQTGHLVLATLHTNDEIEAISRMMELLDDPSKLPVLAMNLTLLHAQRLVRKVCPHCCQTENVTEEQRAIFKKNKTTNWETVQTIKRANPAGCPKCYEGYSGRTAVMALLPATGEFKRLASIGASALELRKYAEGQGFRSLYSEAMERVCDGTTDMAEAELALTDVWEDFKFET